VIDLDALTRAWWRAVGRRVDLAGTEAWLVAPMSPSSVVDGRWQDESAAAVGGTLAASDPDAGLLADMSSLDGPGFAAARLHPAVRDFYEHTSNWQMEVWSAWHWWAKPGGELVARLFGRRVQQLALPTHPLDVAHGMDSSVTVVQDAEGVQRAAIWLRTLRRTGGTVYSGQYSVRTLPGADRPSVHVAFPLQDGNVQVFLRPGVGEDGSLVLESPPATTRRAFGTEGAYVTVRGRGHAYAAAVPVVEHFRVYVDERGALRCDHRLRLWSATALRLHYKLDRSETQGCEDQSARQGRQVPSP